MRTEQPPLTSTNSTDTQMNNIKTVLEVTQESLHYANEPVTKPINLQSRMLF